MDADVSSSGCNSITNNIQRPHVDNIEALKAPVFFLWELLGYGTPRELSEKGIKRVWMASFRSSPGEYLEECLSLLREYKVPISEYDGGTGLRQTLINFYADMMEMYGCRVISCRQNRYQRLYYIVQD